ncbi:MAG: hypothetical protein ABI036_01610 [Fibrobacteria bacterium]
MQPEPKSELPRSLPKPFASPQCERMPAGSSQEDSEVILIDNDSYLDITHEFVSKIRRKLAGK